MNRRDVMKTATAALALPMLAMSTMREAISERRAMWRATPELVPVPVYTYDQRSGRTTFYKYDDNARAAFAYLNRK